MHSPAFILSTRLSTRGRRWWLYKYYDGETPREATLWPARSALIAERVLGADADVVLLQECSAESFESDWAFIDDDDEVNGATFDEVGTAVEAGCCTLQRKPTQQEPTQQEFLQ